MVAWQQASSRLDLFPLLESPLLAVSWEWSGSLQETKELARIFCIILSSDVQAVDYHISLSLSDTSWPAFTSTQHSELP